MKLENAFYVILLKILKVSKIERILSDSFYLKILYRRVLGKNLDLKNPKKFTEKLQWLKLYNRKEEYTLMVDKCLMKEWALTRIENKHIIPTIGVYDKFEDIKWDELPNRFVIKCTHDSGCVFVCKDKTTFDSTKIKNSIESSLLHNYYWNGREWPYKKVKPRIIIEKYLEDESGFELKDYKFFCFNGVVKFFKIDFNRHICHQANYYDINGNLIDLGEKVCPPDYNKKFNMPGNLQEMISFAEKLAVNIPFVRIDLYNVNSDIYLGEITFYPASGLGEFISESSDIELGEMLKLNIHEF